MANPERIQTAMSLYSTKLTSLVLMIDGLHSHDGDIEQSQLILHLLILLTLDLSLYYLLSLHYLRIW